MWIALLVVITILGICSMLVVIVDWFASLLSEVKKIRRAVEQIANAHVPYGPTGCVPVEAVEQEETGPEGYTGPGSDGYKNGYTGPEA